MGNRWSVGITFGGSLHVAMLEQLAEAMESDGAGPDWGGIDRKDAIKLLQEKSDAGETIFLGAHECNWGELPAITSVLQEAGIAYYIDGDGDGCETHPYREIWSPDLSSPELGKLDSTSTDGLSPTVAIDQLKKMRDDGKTIDDVIEYLKIYQPDLPPFRIV